MVLTDWTFTKQYTGTGTLDASIKYAGNSSYKSHADADWTKLTHNTFSETQTQIILWTRADSLSATQTINLSTYGNLSVLPTVINTWEKYRVSFWYDTTTNIKWGRVEQWIAGAWSQIGSDINFGAGSPTTGSLMLYHQSGSFVNAWFDELEVYS